MNAIDQLLDVKPNVPILSRSEFFQSTSTAAVREHINQMREGDTLPITHGWLVSRIGGQTIMIDPAMRANESPQGRFTQMRGKDHVRSDVKDDEYSVNIFQKESTVQVARALAPDVRAILITHLDSDHIDFDLIKKMMAENPHLEVYGPLGWQKFILQTHRLEGETHPTNKPVISENIRTRIHGLSPVSYLGEKPKSLSSAYPGLFQSLHMAILNKGNTNLQITSLDVPHMGSKYAERVQGFLMETEDVRKLILPDASLSPEVIDLVQRLHQEKPLTGIAISTAKFNPEPFVEVHITKKSSFTLPSPELSKKIRDALEEFTSHSAYLPFVLAGVTGAKVPIEMIHFGFYHNSFPDISQVSQRIAFSEKESFFLWADRFTRTLQGVYGKLEGKINKLGPLTSDPQGRRGLFTFLHELKTRSDFSNLLIRWIKDNPPPKTILHDSAHEGPISLPLPLTTIGKEK